MSRPGSKAVSLLGQPSKAVPGPGPLQGSSGLVARLSLLQGREP